MDWTKVYKHIDEVGAGSILGACLDYYNTLYIEWYDYKRGHIMKARFSKVGPIHFWQ